MCSCLTVSVIILCISLISDLRIVCACILVCNLNVRTNVCVPVRVRVRVSEGVVPEWD